MATISNTPRPGYVWDSTDNVWYPIGTGPHTHADYITSGSAINPTIVDAKGDLIVGTAADTVSRLAVGATNGMVLTVDSAEATGLKYATPSSGGMTLIQTLTCSGASVTSSTLTADYKHLYIVGNAISASTNVAVFFRLNGDTGSNYNYSNAVMSGAGNPVNDSTTTTAGNFGNCGTGTAFDSVFTFEMNVPRYATTAYKAIQAQSRGKSGASIENYISSRHNWNNTAAITTLTFGVSSGSFSSGSIYIFGVN